MYTGFGIGSLLICFNILILGLSLAFDRGLNKIINRSFTLLLSCIWISLFCGYFINNKIYSGVFGFEAKNLIINFSGDIGLILLLIFGFIVFMILVLKITPLKTYNFIKDFIEKIKISSKKSIDEYSDDTNEETVENKFVFKNEEEIQKVKPTIENFSKIDSSLINYIIDDSPLKQNRFTPGMHIKILPRKKNFDTEKVNKTIGWHSKNEISNALKTAWEWELKLSNINDN